MDEEAVEPQAEPIEQMMEQAEADSSVQEGNDQYESTDKTMVPLSALQKAREKKRELELELQWEKQERQRLLTQQTATQPPKEDNSRYESATKEDLIKSQEEAVRVVEERDWIRKNPEKFEKIEQFLPQFLKQRPNLRGAIASAANRYEEAFELMEKLTPKQQQNLREAPKPPKKEAPNSPGGVPKSAALNEAVDVMSMTDTEYRAWRETKKRRR
jgi:hypothetical protein